MFETHWIKPLSFELPGVKRCLPPPNRAPLCFACSLPRPTNIWKARSRAWKRMCWIGRRGRGRLRSWPICPHRRQRRLVGQRQGQGRRTAPGKLLRRPHRLPDAAAPGGLEPVGAHRGSGPRALRDYARAVFQATDAYLATVTDAALDRPVDLSEIGLGQVTAGYALMLAAGNCYMHTGEISALKGLCGLTGYPVFLQH